MRKSRLFQLTIVLAILLYTITTTFASLTPPNSVSAAPLASHQAAPASCITPPPNMTAWYPFDEAAGPLSHDIVGGTNGNWIGSPIPVAGMVAGAIKFTGAGGWVAAPNAANLNFGAGDLSIDAWVRDVPGAQGWRVILDKRADTSPALTGYALGQVNGRLFLELGDGSAYFDYVASSGPPVNDGNWHLAAVTVQRSTSAVTLYLDGAIVGVYGSLPASITSAADLWLGHHHTITTLTRQEFDYEGGQLDELEFFNRALTQNEVVTLLQAGEAGKCKDQQPSPTPTTCIPGQTCPSPTPTMCDPARGCVTNTPTPTTCIPGQTCPTPTPTVCTGNCVTNTPTVTPCVPGQTCPTPSPTPCYDPSGGLCATSTPSVTPCVPGQTCPTTTPTVTATPGCVPPPPSMVAWYPLDETAPATSFDIINANNATWYFGPTPIAGKVAGALYFANKSFDQAPNSPTLNFGQGDLSIDMWVKTSTVPGVTTLLDKRAYNVGYEVFLYNGKLGFQLADGSGFSNYVAFGGPNVGDGNWHLIAVTVQRSNVAGLKLYVDGAVVYVGNPTTRPGSITNPFPLRLGGPFPSMYHDRFLRGALDEVELFNRALAGGEIAAIYHAGGSGKCKDQHPTPTATPTATPCPPAAPCPTNTPQASSTPTDTPRPTATFVHIPFVDIAGNVFYTAIADLYSNGAVNGSDSTHFSPGGTATRGQFAKVVVLAFGIIPYTPASPDFSDVPSSYFAYQYIESGYAFGLLGGYDPSTCAAAGVPYPCYRPNLAITRAQLTKLVVSAAGYDLINPDTPTFSDVPRTNVFYQFVETAHQHGVVNGFSGGVFHPNSNIRRDEMCQIVYKGVNNP